MDRKGKILLVVVIIALAISILGSVFLTSKVLTYQQTFDRIAKQTNNFKELKDGTDGNDGVDGDNGHDGHDGVSTISHDTVTSTNTTTTVIKDVPLMGKPGKDGKDGTPAPVQETRLNPSTGDLETKYSDDDIWKIIIPCSKLLVGCPDVTVNIPTVTNPTVLSVDQ